MILQNKVFYFTHPLLWSLLIECFIKSKIPYLDKAEIFSQHIEKIN